MKLIQEALPFGRIDKKELK